MLEPSSTKAANSGTFPVVSLNAGMIRAEEQMGSKDKFWVELPAEFGGGRWLFKEPRVEPEKMEHIAEKLAQEIADVLEIPCARVELAEFSGRRGTISKSVLAEGESLIHGNEIIAGRVDGYDLRSKRRSCNHTFESIQKGIVEACGGQCDDDLTPFIGYLTLDALIGNTDRHHENWALLRRDTPGGISYRLAPSFDHASSLGREMQDQRRSLLLREKRVRQYLLRGAGAIYLAARGDDPIAPLSLVEELFPRSAARFQPWLAELGNVTEERVNSILERLPSGWASETQRDFVRAVILEGKAVLSGLQI